MRTVDLGDGRSLAARAQAFASELPYRVRPFSKRNWGHPLHSLCSYQGKLKPALAHHLIARFTRPGATVLDPLGGVGTVAFEACIAGRRGISNDVSPVATTCATAKLGVPAPGAVFALLGRLERALARRKVPRRRRSLPSLNGSLESYYHPRTLEDVLRARAFFLAEGIAPAPRTPEEGLVLASLLHILHGNRPYALSRRSHPITPFAPSGPVVARPLVPRLRAKVERSLAVERPPNFAEGLALQGDFRELPGKIEPGSVDAVITSPPFVESTRFWLANWIRLWFCGWEPEDFTEQGRPAEFLEVRQRRSRAVYAELFEALASLLRPRGLAVLHLGATARIDMGRELALLARERFSVVGLFHEDVAAIERHGLTDQGATREHELLFLVRDPG
jgi:hypothetical protein